MGNVHFNVRNRRSFRKIKFKKKVINESDLGV